MSLTKNIERKEKETRFDRMTIRKQTLFYQLF